MVPGTDVGVGVGVRVGVGEGVGVGEVWKEGVEYSGDASLIPIKTIL